MLTFHNVKVLQIRSGFYVKVSLPFHGKDCVMLHRIFFFSFSDLIKK